MVWYFIDVDVTEHWMAAWRYKISSLVLLNIWLVHLAQSWYISTPRKIPYLQTAI